MHVCMCVCTYVCMYAILISPYVCTHVTISWIKTKRTMHAHSPPKKEPSSWNKNASSSKKTWSNSWNVKKEPLLKKVCMHISGNVHVRFRSWTMSFQELGSFFFCFGGECACKIQELDHVFFFSWNMHGHFLKYAYTLFFKTKTKSSNMPTVCRRSRFGEYSV